MRKLNGMQLSRVLSEKCGPGLGLYGWDVEDEEPRMCIAEAAFCKGYAWDLRLWFDNYYNPQWTVERFLARLREVGAA